VTGTGPLVVAVPGMGDLRSTYRDLVPALVAAGYRVAVTDLRGHGDSPLPTEAFGLDQLVEDLEALRARLGIEQMHIIGHSLGGMIGPAYAHR